MTPAHLRAMEENMTNPSESSKLHSEIIKILREHWDKTNTPLLLSRLGSMNNGQIAMLAKQHAESLRAYLGNELGEQVRVIQHDTKPSVIGVIPADATDDTRTNYNSLLELTLSQPSSARPHIPRFQSAFWTAFRVPLRDSKRRYLSIKNPPHFQDLEPTDNQPINSVEIEPGDIVDEHASIMDVYHHILKWLASHNLEPDAFQQKGNTSATSLPAHDLLGQILLALHPEELGRISLPLDIVKKLRATPR